MGIVKNIIGKINKLFQSRKPSSKVAAKSKLSKARQRFMEGGIFGHRGIAAGDLENVDVSRANIRQWRKLTKTQAEGFLDGERLYVHSTNVSFFQYDKASKTLVVGFKGGGVYAYDPVTEGEAIRALQEMSKGNFVWSKLRIRGTKYGHKKNYRKL